MLTKREELFGGVPDEYLSHKEKYENSMRKAVLLFSILRKIQKDNNTDLTNYRYCKIIIIQYIYTYILSRYDLNSFSDPGLYQGRIYRVTYSIFMQNWSFNLGETRDGRSDGNKTLMIVLFTQSHKHAHCTCISKLLDLVDFVPIMPKWAKV